MSDLSNTEQNTTNLTPDIILKVFALSIPVLISFLYLIGIGTQNGVSNYWNVSLELFELGFYAAVVRGIVVLLVTIKNWLIFFLFVTSIIILLAYLIDKLSKLKIVKRINHHISPEKKATTSNEKNFAKSAWELLRASLVLLILLISITVFSLLTGFIYSTAYFYGQSVADDQYKSISDKNEAFNKDKSKKVGFCGDLAVEQYQILSCNESICVIYLEIEDSVCIQKVV